MLVSVVVPVHNHAAFVADALRSVHDQDWPAIELIVIDDASSDESPAVVERLVGDAGFAGRFHAVVFERNPANLGAARTIERGLALAQGAVLTILNSDDLYAPERLTRCIAALDDDHQLVFSGVACIDGQGRPDPSPAALHLGALPRSAAAYPTVSSAFLGVNRAVSTGNLVFTRRLHRRVGGFRDMPYCHDWDFVLAAMLETEPRLVDGALYRYRLHGTNSFRDLGPLARLEGERCLGRFFEQLQCGRIANPSLRALTRSPAAWGRLIAAADPGVATIAADIARGARPRGLEPPPTKAVATDLLLVELGQRLDPARETVLIVTPAADRSGGAILALNLAGHLRDRYNTVLLAMAGGELLGALGAAFGRVVVPDRKRLAKRGWLAELVDDMVDRLSIDHAVCNGQPPAELSHRLFQRNVPTVLLAHAPIDGASAGDFTILLASGPGCGEAHARPAPVGPSSFSMAPSQDAMRQELERLRREIGLAPGRRDPFVVLGLGSIGRSDAFTRFLAAAAAFRRHAADRPARFVWIGTGDAGAAEMAAAREAVVQLDGAAAVVASTVSIEAALRLAQAMLVTARHDLPIAMLDAMTRGIPTICLADAAGANWPVVAPEAIAADADAAGALLAAVAGAGGRRHPLGAQQRAAVAAAPAMADHADAVAAAMGEAQAIVRQQAADIATLVADDLFDCDLHQPPAPRADMIAHYVRPAVRPAVPRRPFSGFRPGLYRALLDAAAAVADPAAAFVRAGRPAGPWQRQVLRPGLRPPAAQARPLRIGLHLHAYYDELAPDLFRRLLPATPGAIAPDLLVSTDSEAKAARLAATAAAIGLPPPDIRVWPNRGRDLGPFLTGCGREWLDRYDIVGHVHAKQSRYLQANGGNRWRAFLLENVLGGFAPMMAFTMGWMSADPGLGLVYPDDPYLFGWNWHDPDDPAARADASGVHFGAESNRTIAERLARRMGLGPLPAEVDFPAGSMFWARSQALAPLFDLGLGWDDYPAEPLPHDGTILHALERLLPLVVESRGFRAAVTHIPGIGR